MRVHTAGTCKLSASVMTIGALDGVHRGHQALICQARKRALVLGVPLVVYTFDPPPRVFFQQAMQLTTIEEKLHRLEHLSVDHVVVAGFDAEYSTREGSSFLRELRDLHPLEIWVGHDFRFGSNRGGDISTLRESFPVNVLDSILCSSGEIISSSRIRALLMQDRHLQAEQLLGWQTVQAKG
ncbi:FAD synthetase [Brevibacillus choshinensis]|uniref:FAD synthase n=1 Tax=Brevibacillus choshinensis TaxID=54911 RepID=A0ABR5N1C0_BRECH|nr:FAD synthetase family protein [Brevibacillus choshinensis]KQL44271.1 FAD synthetase [Brevibacillus choshinensis]